MEDTRFFITGDIHGDLTRIWEFIDKIDINYENCNIIIAGDAGLCWRHDKADLARNILLHESNYKTHIWFIDGNHENFKVLKSFPIDEDGIAHISKHIHYLPRGSKLILNFGSYTKTLLAMGGADSVDKNQRTSGLNWWEDERITEKDIEGINGYYDYVITHCCPSHIFNNNKVYLCTLGNIIDDANADFHESEKMLEKLYNNIDFDMWYFGHYHTNLQVDIKFKCIFDTFEEIF